MCFTFDFQHFLLWFCKTKLESCYLPYPVIFAENHAWNSSTTSFLININTPCTDQSFADLLDWNIPITCDICLLQEHVLKSMHSQLHVTLFGQYPHKSCPFMCSFVIGLVLVEHHNLSSGSCLGVQLLNVSFLKIIMYVLPHKFIK